MKVREVFTILLVSVFTVTALLISAAIGCAPKPEEEKVFRVGNVGAFSGPYADWGWMIQPSYEIAVEDINAAGGLTVGGKNYRVELVQYDNQLDPTVSSTIVRKAIFDDGLKYLMVMSTDEAAAVNELCNTEKVVLFAEAPYRDYIGPEWPYSFQTFNEIIEGDEVIMDYLLKEHPEFRSVVVIAPDDVRGHAAADDFEQLVLARGFTIDIVYTEAGVTDFYSVLTPLLAENPDLISLSASAPVDQGHIIKQARELGFEGLFMHPDTIDTPTIAEIAGMDALEGNLAAPQLVEMPTEVGKRWGELYIEKYGSLVYWTAFTGYDPFMLLMLAIEKADTFDTEQVIEALGTVSFDGASGRVSFEANRYSGGLPRVIKVPLSVIQIQNGIEVDVYSGYSSIIWE